MTVATVLPFVPAQWFTSAGDAVLSGGQLWFYAVGTTTPKTVYADYAATTPHAQPVVLNASGKATVFLGAGGYKVVLKDALGAVMDTVDGVFGDPYTAGGGTLQISVATFVDLRAFVNPGAVTTVSVAGALVQGDGGGGLFTFDPSITTPDDGGVYIAPSTGTGRWVRSISGIPSISWWGIKGVTAESDDAAIANAFAYCNAGNLSLVIDRKNVGLRANKTFSGSKLIFSGGFFWTAATTPNITMSGGATIEADAHDLVIAGGGGIVYGDGQAISPEWTSATLDDSGLLIAINAAGSAKCKLVIYSPYTCTGFFSSPANLELDFAEGGRLSFTATASLTVGRMGYVGRNQIFSYDTIGHVGSVSISTPEIFPEWFGAVGDGATNDAVAVYAAAKTGRVDFASGKAYVLGAGWTTPASLAIKGGIVILSGTTLGTGSLYLESTIIVKASGSWFAGTFLQAVNSEVPATYTATTQSVTGCKTTGSSLFPTSKGAPYIENAHLDLLSAQLLGTDATGKVIPGKTNIPPNATILGTNASGDIVNTGTSPALDMLSFSSMFFASWSVAPLSGTVTLTSPLKFIYMVDNISAAADITLPTPIAGSSTVVVLFPMRRVNTVTIRGTFPSIGTTSITTLSATLLYYDRASSGWYFLHSDQ